MRNNKTFALAFRAGAFIFAIAGVLTQIGVFKGFVSFNSFMYYTIQSNILVIFLFALLAVRTARSMGIGAFLFLQGHVETAKSEVKDIKLETRGFTGFYARFEYVCVINIMLTFVVFWTLLVPTVTAEYLWTFENLAVHGITPLICLIDYLLFTEGGHLKRKDIFLTMIFPVFYVIFSAVAGLAGYVYGYTGTVVSVYSSYIEFTPIRAPYFFLDYWSIGAWTFAYIAGILVVFLLFAYLLYCADKKRKAMTGS